MTAGDAAAREQRRKEDGKSMQATRNAIAALAIAVVGYGVQPVSAQSAEASGSKRLTWSPTVSNRHVGLRAAVEW